MTAAKTQCTLMGLYVVLKPKKKDLLIDLCWATGQTCLKSLQETVSLLKKVEGVDESNFDFSAGEVAQL